MAQLAHTDISSSCFRRANTSQKCPERLGDWSIWHMACGRFLECILWLYYAFIVKFLNCIFQYPISIHMMTQRIRIICIDSQFCTYSLNFILNESKKWKWKDQTKQNWEKDKTTKYNCKWIEFELKLKILDCLWKIIIFFLILTI